VLHYQRVGYQHSATEETGGVMTPSQRAFLDAQIALSAWRAARDAEAQVAHWLTEGRATREELTEFRLRTHVAHEAHSHAQRAYHRACGQQTGQIRAGQIRRKA